MSQKNIIHTPLYKGLQYLYAFLMTNIYFIISNILIILTFFSIPTSFSSIPLYYIALIPMGPSLIALFYTMGKLHREKIIQPTKDFFQSYKKNFFISIRYWLIQLTLITILSVDIVYLISKGHIIWTIISVIAWCFILIATINGFAILATFEVKVKNLVVFSLLMIKNYFLKALLSLMTLLSFAIIWYGYPSEATLGVFSIVVYFLMRTNYSALFDLKKNYSTETGEHL